jgi:cytochrome P450
LPRLGYVERVFAEAMRLYPPAWAMGRRSLQPVTIGPWTLPEISVFVLSPYVTHRDPRWWPEPERFDPDRFLSAITEERPKFAYFPFGGGPRVCVGERFSWMEGVLLLATLGQMWRFRSLPHTRAEIQPLITLRPRNPILLCPDSRRK